MYGRLSVMDVERPYAAVCPTLDGDVLRVLAGTTRLLTGREVARLTGRTSHSGVLDALNRLAEHGLVTRMELNRAFLFALNRDHLAAPAVDILMGMRQELFRRIRCELATWRIAPVHVSLFGSTARGDGDTRSDIDLLVVRSDDIDEEHPSWRAQIDGLSDQIQRWTGNYAAIIERTNSQIAQLSADELPFIAELRSDAIVLGGPQSPAVPTAA
jgi:predicted nucleotidyltransferase